MDAIVDRFVVNRKHEKAIKAGIAAALLVGDGLMQVHILAVRARPMRRSSIEG
jgi:excinuclease ABC subunit A